jgi:hypothetical protein
MYGKDKVSRQVTLSGQARGHLPDIPGQEKQANSRILQDDRATLILNFN